jgi:hypothetical protein
MPRASTIRLVALLGIAIALFGMDALEIDIFQRSRDFTFPRQSQSTAPGSREVTFTSRSEPTSPWPRDLTLREGNANSRHRGTSTKFTLCDSSNQWNCVVDGDSIHYGGLKIRLDGIDTPEIHKPKCTSELDRGRRARDRLLELMNAGRFEVVYKGGPDEDKELGQNKRIGWKESRMSKKRNNRIRI